ncbi:sulfatase [Streptomyces sp. NPDC059850]|uniref:sulfatase family protein n=1 Tax=Streptomyces sp. NPDC059850 TaxID=3346970 RepID=UPI0036688D18
MIVTPTRPDVVLIHCHDLGRWLSCYGQTSVPSPNLQRFAERSVVFERAFATAPLCSPARGSLFTGLSPHRHGVMGLAHHAWRYRKGVATLPELLEPLGYDTSLIGLQHENVDPAVLGFGEVGGVGFLPRAWPVVEAAESWLAERATQSERAPFLLTVGLWEVHRPWPAEDYEHADPAEVEVPAYLPDNEHSREDIAAFYGSIRQMDAAVGHLLRRVDEIVDPRNTMVVFTTDHGAAFPRAKGTLYDPGTGVALIVRPPLSWGVPPGPRPDLVSHLDVVPTLLELAGGEPPQDLGLEGVSLLPLLRGTPAAAGSDDQAILPPGEDERLLFTGKTYHDSYDPMRAVRSERYKYIRNFVSGPMLRLSQDLEHSPTRRGLGDGHLRPRPEEELYDLCRDPWEQENVADDPSYEKVRGALAQRLDRWMSDTCDPLATGPIGLPPARSRAFDALPALPPVSP